MGNDLFCRSQGKVPELRVPAKEAADQCCNWAARYDQAVKHGQAEVLYALGQEMFQILNRNGWAEAWLKGTGPCILEIQAEDLTGEFVAPLLNAPWELLTNGAAYLVDNVLQPFSVFRRIGQPAASPLPPAFANISLLFMAAAPEGQHELAFEAEEAGILEVTEGLPLLLSVEESGSLVELKRRISKDGPFEALHLSCHGDIDKDGHAVLALENDVGEMVLATGGEVADALISPEKQPLVFLSACRTAEQVETMKPGQTEPFVRALISAGVANVLGWDGSVYDADAMNFAKVFYQELAHQATVPQAAMKARHALRRANQADPKAGRHWHLARLYLGPQGGGALTDSAQEQHDLANLGHEDQFLDEGHHEVPVASRAAFVGRRRQIQAVLKAFRRPHGAGVLVHGMGNLGKSSLAARIANRLTDHQTVVVFARYDALSVFDRILEAVPLEKRHDLQQHWRPRLETDENVLKNALEALLKALRETPILLVVDDLERILEAPVQSERDTGVQSAYRQVMTALLMVFARPQWRYNSHLLLTSRYCFGLPDSRGQDLASALVRVPLQPMSQREQQKQWQASRRLSAHQAESEQGAELVARALRVAAGNPGLQTILTQPVLAGENAVAEAALVVIEQFQHTGVAPAALQELIDQGLAQDEGNALLAFFKRMAFDQYRQALTTGQALLLRACDIFESGFPWPRVVFEAAAAAVLPEDTPAGPALQRLLGLGLLDDWGVVAAAPQLGVNPLACPLVKTTPLPEALKQTCLAAAIPVLATAWRNAEGDIHHDHRAVLLTDLVLQHPDTAADLLQAAAIAAGRYLFGQQQLAREAYALLAPAHARLSQQSIAVAFDLLILHYDCARQLGEAENLPGLLSQLIESAAPGTVQQAAALQRQSEAVWQQGDSADAIEKAAAARDLLRQLGDYRAAAVMQGQIADILMQRGVLDEALRIRTEEVLPVYRQLGDVSSVAVTQGKIADILMQRGVLDEALRICRQEVLPAFQQLGDVRSVAVTQGKIADILMQRGALDEVLRIRTEEQLPVYRQLGDVRELAITQGKIADILMQRGALDEALRICRQEMLPAFQQLGDVRELAVTQGKIADILTRRGALDEALAYYQQQLVTGRQLSDQDMIASALFSCVRVYLAQEKPAATGQEMFDMLSEAFQLVKQLQRPDGIVAIGLTLAQVLILATHYPAAEGVLATVAEVARAVGSQGGPMFAQALETVQELRAEIAARQR
jgi:tetratricopeptide (TPR) repeat protein